ncbi:MAG: sugar transporter [Neisseriaceae bacterium]|nr:sugar transporter [Neisseriaceae bacterium]
MTQSDLQTHQTAWIRVLILAVAAFVFNTTEFIPVALLSDIGASFAMAPAQTGLMMTIYAWMVALTSLPLMLLTQKIERRKLLIVLFVVFILSHIVSGMANSFTMLLLGRIGVALAHAVFWSITATLAIRMAPAGKKAQALGLLATGTALATVLGLPLGRIIGQLVGWRVTFMVIAAIAVIALIALIKYLPPLPSRHSGSLKSIPLLLKRPALLGVFFLTAIMITGHFTAYSYIEPFAHAVAARGQNFATLLLLVFGGAGIIGSLLFSRYSGRYQATFLSTAIGFVTLCLALLLWSASNQWTFIGLTVVWGMALMCLGLGLQVKVIDLSPDAADLAMAIYSGIFNIGIGAGALLGNQTISHLGLRNVGYAGAALGFISLCLSVWLFSKYRPALTASTSTH